MDKINAGYRAFTGHIFTQSEADAYNAACERARRNPSEANKNAAHNLFSAIVTLPRGVKG